MSAATLSIPAVSLSQRKRLVREGWTSEERRRRQTFATGKLRELALLILSTAVQTGSSLRVAQVERLAV